MVLIYIRLVLCYSCVPIAWYLVYIRLVLCYSYLLIGTWYIYALFCAILTCLLVLVYIRLVLCYSYLYIYAWFSAIFTCLLVLSINTPGFVLFLRAYWYLYIYAWFCAILTCLLVLVYIYIYAWFCAIPTCLLVLSIYTPGFVLFLLAYLYLVYIRLVLCYSYLPISIGTWHIIRLVLCYSYLPIGSCIYAPGFVLFLRIDIIYLVYTRNELASLAHSFYTCLKPPHSSDNCTLQVCIYTLGP